jgi:hypothetical protein
MRLKGKRIEIFPTYSVRSIVLPENVVVTKTRCMVLKVSIPVEDDRLDSGAFTVGGLGREYYHYP